MKLPQPHFPVRRRAAFTLVEIALSLAIIGFALVAIIGALPFGLNVQKENRQETAVVQDANYFLDAIRSGARGLDDLTNYVDSITNYVTRYSIQNDLTNIANIPAPDIYGYTFARAAINNNDVPANVITNGQRIVGLLSTPKIIPLFINNNPLANPIPEGFISNYVIAYVRSLSGPAIDKAPQTNAVVRDLAFRYRLICEVSAFDNVNRSWIDFTVPGLTADEIVTRSNAWRLAVTRQSNLHEVRLLFRWPVDSRGAAGNQRQIFRTVVSGTLGATEHRGLPIWLMQSGNYQAVQ
jgi:type II secretory pathway pseudopilin PulG